MLCWAGLDVVAGTPVIPAGVVVVPTMLLPPSLPLPFELLLPEPPELGLRLLWLPLLEVLFFEWWCCVPPTAPPTTAPMTSTMAMTIAVMPQRVRYHGVFASFCSWPFSICPCLRARAMAPGL